MSINQRCAFAYLDMVLPSVASAVAVVIGGEA